MKSELFFIFLCQTWSKQLYILHLCSHGVRGQKGLCCETVPGLCLQQCDYLSFCSFVSPHGVHNVWIVKALLGVLVEVRHIFHISMCSSSSEKCVMVVYITPPRTNRCHFSHKLTHTHTNKHTTTHCYYMTPSTLSWIQQRTQNVTKKDILRMDVWSLLRAVALLWRDHWTGPDPSPSEDSSEDRFM